MPGTQQAQQKKGHSVTLKWNAPVARSGETIVGYNVYQSDEENGRYALIARNNRSRTYTDHKVKSGQTYYYKVTSVDKKGRESSAATTKTAVP